MKRSEALDLIWQAINELEDADHILTRLEQAGMLPPKFSKHIDSPTIHPSWKAEVNEWEPENE
jgi:hypothetical protein